MDIKRFAVVGEDHDGDVYDMSYNPIAIIKVVEAYDEREAIDMVEQEGFIYHYHAYQVSDDTELGEHDELPEAL